MSPHGGEGVKAAVHGGIGFPALGPGSQRNSGCFLVMERTNSGETLEKISPFLIDKAIRNCCGEVAIVKRIREGKILLQTKTEKQVPLLKKMVMITSGINVVITDHSTLNKCRVVITCRELNCEKEEVILEELAEQKVIQVDRIKKRVDGDLVKTSSYILTLSTTNMPAFIKIGFLRVPTRPYYPRPTRCYKCLRFGHIGKECELEEICANCSEPSHADVCTRPPKCANCLQSHKSNSPVCPIWITETEIIRLKVDRGISHLEAKKIVEQRNVNQQTYASKVSGNMRNCSCKCTCSKIPTESTDTTDRIIVLPSTSKSTETRKQRTVKEPTNITETATTSNNKSNNIQKKKTELSSQSDSPSISPKTKRMKKVKDVNSEETSDQGNPRTAKKLNEPTKTTEPAITTKRRAGRPRKQLTDIPINSDNDETSSEMEV